MFTFTVILALGVAVLWLRGRALRRVWERSDRTTIRFLPALDAEGSEISSNCATLIITGAFNGPASTERIVASVRMASDAYVLDYASLVFRPMEAVHSLYRALVKADAAKRKVDGIGYEVVVAIGGSLGGLLSLLFIAHDRRHGGRFRSSLCVMGIDSPLYANHLLMPGADKPVPSKLAAWLTSLRPGPIWNWLASFVMSWVFVELPVEQHSPQTDQDQWKRHMAFLRRTRLSLFLSQAGAIVGQRPLDPADYVGIPGGYLKCGGKDEVIDAEAAHAEWEHLIPNLVVATVPATGHMQFVEHDFEWRVAIVKMWRELIERVVQAKHDAANR